MIVYEQPDEIMVANDGYKGACVARSGWIREWIEEVAWRRIGRGFMVSKLLAAHVDSSHCHTFFLSSIFLLLD